MIRPAFNEDIPILEELFYELSNWKLDRKDLIRKAIDGVNEILLVAELEGKIVGFIHETFYNDPLHAAVCSQITALFVKDRFRRRGIASNLLRKVLEDAKQKKVQEIHVSTRYSNKAAIQLYEKNSFRKEGILFEINPT